jgi:hypothetical protein
MNVRIFTEKMSTFSSDKHASNRIMLNKLRELWKIYTQKDQKAKPNK